MHQYGGARGSHLFDCVKNFHHCLGTADHPIDTELALHFRAEFLVFAAGIALPEGTLDEDFQPVDIHWLRDEVIRTPLHRLDSRIHRSIGSHHDTNRRVRLLNNAFDKRHAVLLTETQVCEDDIHRHTFQGLKRPVGVGCKIDVEISLQRVTKAVTGIFFVINNQQRCGHACE